MGKKIFKWISSCVVIFLIIGCSENNKDYLTGSGTMEATEVVVSARTSGQVVDLKIREGDRVREGQVLAQVEVEKLLIQKEQLEAGMAEVEFNITNAKHAIAQAQENFGNIEKRYQRIKALHQKGSVTQQQMDDLETQYKLAQTQLITAKTTLQAALMRKKQMAANLKLLESQIADATLVAPVNGVVIEKFLEKGETVTMGMPVVAIADLTNLWIKLYVTERELGFVKLGAEAEIAVDSFPDKKFKGKVVWISPRAEFTPKNIQTKEARADLVYAVKIAVSNPDEQLKIGMPADVFLKKEM